MCISNERLDFCELAARVDEKRVKLFICLFLTLCFTCYVTVANGDMIVKETTFTMARWWSPPVIEGFVLWASRVKPGQRGK